MTSFTHALLASVTILVASTSARLLDTPAAPTGARDTMPTAASPRHTVLLGLNGYSPVSYLDQHRAEPGSPQHAAEHRGVTYFFTSDRQRSMFVANPDRYLPAYGGYCAFGCSVNSQFVPDPTSFDIIDGRTHLFLKTDDVDARQLWHASDSPSVKAKADAYWASRTVSRAYTQARNVPASGIALDGYSPVSYFSGTPEMGDPRFSVEHHGVTYHLTSPQQMELFTANPDRYEPQCGGWCAFGMAVEDKFPIDPTKFAIVDDKLYLFLNNAQVDALALWTQGDERDLVRKAQAHWKKVSGGA